MTEFDPATHRMVPAQRWFEDFVLGERFVLPSRTQTTAIFAALAAVSISSRRKMRVLPAVTERQVAPASTIAAIVGGPTTGTSKRIS